MVSVPLPEMVILLWMPGLIVADELPLRLSEPYVVNPNVVGGFSGASGSATEAALVTGAGLKLAFPLFETLPLTSITAAFTAALPLADRAVDELEST